MTGSKILIVDDEPEMLENLDRLLSAEGYRCWTVSNSEKVGESLAKVRPDVLITDLRMPGVDGMEVLSIAQAADQQLPILLITAYATVASAVQAIQEGAFDYLAKPFTGDQLSIAVERALRHRRLVLENETLRGQIDSRRGTQIIGSSAPFVRVLDQTQRVAATEANILITGESGTGKELLAQSLHRQSQRAHAPFIPVDCAALPEGLLESELFGHEKGAFTGAVGVRKGLLEEADGGTVFLDEVAELSVPLQAKLLRVLQEREVRPVGGARYVKVDVRMVAATNRDLDAAVQEGTFRDDLYYRLNVVHLSLPPLRARTGDVVLLVERFLNEFAAVAGKTPPVISSEVWDALQAYDWPGNIRQLRNLVEQIVALDVDGRVTLSNLPPQIKFGGDAPGEGELATPESSSWHYEEAKEAAIQQFRASYLRRLLDAHKGNVSQAARTAGVSRRTLHRWLAQIGADNVESIDADADDDT
jgi:DNA-binding NtrC family response regulator